LKELNLETCPNILDTPCIKDCYEFVWKIFDTIFLSFNPEDALGKYCPGDGNFAN